MELTYTKCSQPRNKNITFPKNGCQSRISSISGYKTIMFVFDYYYKYVKDIIQPEISNWKGLYFQRMKLECPICILHITCVKEKLNIRGTNDHYCLIQQKFSIFAHLVIL